MQLQGDLDLNCQEMVKPPFINEAQDKKIDSFQKVESRQERKPQETDKPPSKDIPLLKRLKRARDEKADSLRKVTQLQEQLQQLMKKKRKAMSTLQPVLSSQACVYGCNGLP
jgi:hypothetical protein